MDASRYEAIADLLRKQLNGDLTETGKSEWEQWLAESPDNRDLAARLADPQQLKEDLKVFYSAKENILLKIKQRVPELHGDANKKKAVVVKLSFLHRRFARYAAILIVVLGVAGILWMNQRPTKQLVVVEKTVQTIIHPGTNKAVLTLGNGSKIILDSSHQGIIAKENGTNISVQDNQLMYQSQSGGNSNAFNTMTTPRGGQYKLLLPDGTAVWLNAQSSITFPVKFTGKERKVSITGEVYFEVAKDAARPFIVDVHSKAEIEVLGTHFDVNTYEEEPVVSTTLLEGSVIFRNEKNKQVLKPNQQVKMGNDETLHVADLQKSSLNEVMAWKNGAFYFEEADIKSVMRQLARWYDFDITYTGEVKEKFHLDLQRNTSIENIFRILEETRGVHFKIEGKKITAMPLTHP